MLIRIEEEKDWIAVHSLNASVFKTETEANLVDSLRKKTHPLVSLIAEDNTIIVGHIMFTPVSLSGHTNIKIMGLAPLTVTAENQGKGIGSELIRAGLRYCKQLEFGAVVVLGHSEYYPRFGFSPSSCFGIGCEFDVPKEFFMVMELQSGYLSGKSGIVEYHAAFSD